MARATLLRWLLACASLAVACGSSLRASRRYLLASFPDMAQINYLRVPDPTWRPLVLEGVLRPRAIAVDAIRMRLFIADETAMKVIWFQMSLLSSGLLMTDGRSHVVMTTVEARSLAVNDRGDLLVAGRFDPGPPVTPAEAIFHFSASQIADTVFPNIVQEPRIVWTTEGAGGGNPATAQLTAPSAVAVDALSVYWGNGNKPDPDGGSVVRGALRAPAERAEGYAAVLANNVAEVDAVVITAAEVYYASGDKLYGVPKRKGNEMCGDDGASCPSVLNVTGQQPKISAMSWDADGDVVYAADQVGRILSFDGDSLDVRGATKVAEAPGVFGVAFVVPFSRAGRAAAAAPGALVLAVLALVAGVGARA